MLKIAHDKIDSTPAGHRLGRWIQCIRALKSFSNTLIPPYEVILYETAVALAMPYGEGGALSSLAHWENIDQHIAKSTDLLLQQRLKIDDKIQVRTQKGIPFICDLSDLVRI